MAEAPPTGRTGPRQAARDDRRGRDRARLDDRRRGLRSVRAGGQAAGSGLLLGLALAAGVAYCNAVASAGGWRGCLPDLRRHLHLRRCPARTVVGFTAGLPFDAGKVASCAAMALTFAAYAVPGSLWAQRLLGVAAVLVLAALNYRGIAKTAAITRALVALALTALVVVVVAVWTNQPQHVASLAPSSWLTVGGIHGVLQSAGLIFFAFAGYARIATLGEEVKDPARTIPRAIPSALGIAVVVYVAVAVSALAATGPAALGAATAPLTATVQAVGAGGLSPVVRIGAVVASLGSLVALIAGIGLPYDARDGAQP